MAASRARTYRCGEDQAGLYPIPAGLGAVRVLHRLVAAQPVGLDVPDPAVAEPLDPCPARLAIIVGRVGL